MEFCFLCWLTMVKKFNACTRKTIHEIPKLEQRKTLSEGVMFLLHTCTYLLILSKCLWELISSACVYINLIVVTLACLVRTVDHFHISVKIYTSLNC